MTIGRLWNYNWGYEGIAVLILVSYRFSNGTHAAACSRCKAAITYIGVVVLFPSNIRDHYQEPVLSGRILFLITDQDLSPRPASHMPRSSTVLLEFPVPVVEGTHLAGLQPSRNAVKMESMLFDTDMLE